MPRTAYYDDNANRRFPFVSTPEIEAAPEAADQLPDFVLLDCGFTFAMYTGADARTRVWLDSVAYDSGTLTLTFETDAVGVDGAALTIEIPLANPDFNLGFGTCVGSAEDPLASSCPQLLWQGYAVVTGDTAKLLDMGDKSGLDAEQHSIEPALLRTTDGTYVRAYGIANRDRVRVTDPPGIERPIIVQSECRQGPLRFKEGYNCRITYDAPRNGLTINAVVGAGEGETCVEVPLEESEVPSEDGELLSGGPRCTEVVKSVNGLGGPRLRLRGGPGVQIVKNAENPSQIDVTVDPSLLATCDVTGA